MSINQEIQRINQAKVDIKEAIEEKGVTVGDGTLDTYPEKIAEISGGGEDKEYTLSVRNKVSGTAPSMTIPLGSNPKTFTLEDITISWNIDDFLASIGDDHLGHFQMTINDTPIDFQAYGYPTTSYLAPIDGKLLPEYLSNSGGWFVPGSLGNPTVFKDSVTITNNASGSSKPWNTKSGKIYYYDFTPLTAAPASGLSNAYVQSWTVADSAVSNALAYSISSSMGNTLSLWDNGGTYTNVHVFTGYALELGEEKLLVFVEDGYTFDPTSIGYLVVQSSVAFQAQAQSTVDTLNSLFSSPISGNVEIACQYPEMAVQYSVSYTAKTSDLQNNDKAVTLKHRDSQTYTTTSVPAVIMTDADIDLSSINTIYDYEGM